MKQPLAGRVAVVAGATRGTGRGIACELGAAGATVYCTGRSTRANRQAVRDKKANPFDLANRPETSNSRFGLLFCFQQITSYRVAIRT